jgi:tetratricopeptide (TPR) repeat protein
MRILDPARDILIGLVEYDPSIYQAQLALSGYYSISQRHDDALHVINKLLTSRPDSVRALQQRADILTSKGLHDEAIQDWTQILEYNKNHHGYYGRGLCYYHKKNLKLALADFKNANRIQADTRSYNALGKCLKELGQDMEAVTAHTKALNLDPSNKEAALDIGIAYMSQSQPDEAGKFIAKALSIDPNFMTAYGWRALMYDNMGEAHLVLQDVYKTLSFDPRQLTT